jgi:hypothetical protein
VSDAEKLIGGSQVLMEGARSQNFEP